MSQQQQKEIIMTDLPSSSSSSLLDDDEEGDISNTTAHYYGQFKPMLDIPTMWSKENKNSCLEVSNRHLRVTYKQTKEVSDAALIKANHHIPPACGIYYFEITVISKGRDGYIGIGLCTNSMAHSKLPGWERNSYGYHGDDGNLFKCSGTGKHYGPTYTTGDTVGCCINFVNNTLFFTKNGVPLGEAANDIKGLTLYPCVGLRTPQESVEANFGEKKFQFEISQYFKEEKQKSFKSIQSIPTTNEELISTQLVLGYLIHHGYPETVKLFASATGIVDDTLNSQLDYIKNRQTILDLLLNGEIEKVIIELNRLYPDFLQKRKDILFKLQCQKFIEMIKHSPIEDTMAFGTKELYSFLPEYENSLHEIFSLIAYQDPFKSPVAHLLDKERREPIAKDLNCALLVYSNKPSTPILERVVRQTKVVMDESVKKNACPSSIFMNVNEFLQE
ncbi:hypothetical protein DFA_09447 [Cavenderia fasciculata]|uniref:Uncharacterized protein n=1 Tax=Cavenderia fasciculata TaxID=261658 RepID=F4Q7N0_CACFS|nr:uncharacterized protein DFA_09447 [Cavenderia fasciculata]EGG16412.1 hypothetical protein DFA_09447 [Cavenderia fasciculata]|eukprot:XP_004354796.1 hypothetical protein DFA_09447 [Cavenderia fasciculata]